MAEVWIDEAGWEDGDLPDVCLECGADAPDRVRKTFVYQPPWAYVTILLGLLILVIVLLVTRKQFRSRVPLCSEHKNHWTKRTLWVLGSFVVAVLVVILGVVLANLVVPRDPALLIVAVVVLSLIGWIIALVTFQFGTIRVTKISKREILLAKVSPAFVDAYEADRDREDELRRRGKAGLDPAVRQHWNEQRRPRRSDDEDESIRRDRPDDDSPRRRDEY